MSGVVNDVVLRVDWELSGGEDRGRWWQERRSHHSSHWVVHGVSHGVLSGGLVSTQISIDGSIWIEAGVNLDEFSFWSFIHIDLCRFSAVFGAFSFC